MLNYFLWKLNGSENSGLVATVTQNDTRRILSLTDSADAKHQHSLPHNIKKLINK